jgi:hypothetical protein
MTEAGVNPITIMREALSWDNDQVEQAIKDLQRMDEYGVTPDGWVQQ